MVALTPAAAAREAGATAHRAGLPFHANPHPLGTSRSKEWSRGWNLESAAALRQFAEAPS